MNHTRAVAFAVFPVFLAVGLCLALFWLSGYDALNVASGVLEGALTGKGSIIQTVRWAMPLLLLALGFMFSVRAGEFNIGGQGQMMLGALGAVVVALLMPGPSYLIIPLAILLGMLSGAVWSGFAGWLKVRHGADEVIVTLMMNFVAALLISWITTGPLKDPATRGDTASTPRIDGSLRLSGSDGVSISLLIILAVAVVLAWLIAERSRFGLQSRYAGETPEAARWQGMKVERLKLEAYLLCGVFAGLAGALEVLGPNARLVTGATPTIGFTALVVTIVGMRNVFGIVIASLFFGGLQAATLFLPIVSDLPTSGLRIIEGAIALLITARFFWRNKG